MGGSNQCRCQQRRTRDQFQSSARTRDQFQSSVRTKDQFQSLARTTDQFYQETTGPAHKTQATFQHGYQVKLLLWYSTPDNLQTILLKMVPEL